MPEMRNAHPDKNKQDEMNQSLLEQANAEMRVNILGLVF